MVGALLLAASASLVNLFVGSQGVGHVAPHACRPMALVQAGPDTGTGLWKYTAGYQYDDTRLLGFTQDHFSGTGVGDLGDLRLMPFVGEAGGDWFGEMDKASERAEPGYYRVRERRFGTDVEITASQRVAFYRIRYPEGAAPKILLDLMTGLGTQLGDYHLLIEHGTTTVESDRLVTGWVKTHGWNERVWHFAVAFSRSAAKIAELPRGEKEPAPRLVAEFAADGDNVMEVKVALSARSVDGARRNLLEIPDWDFDRVRAEAHDAWESVLSRVEVGGTEEQREMFATALYRLYVQPHDISDLGECPDYSTFSLWDTFRAAHPWYTLAVPEKVPKFVESMVRHWKKAGFLPIWACWGYDNQCMIGSHAVPVIVDWFLKTHDATVDWNAAYAAVKDTLTARHEGRKKESWDLYEKYGYYPFDEIKGESVSRTLECAYDDWCAAQFARALGKKDDAARFEKRAAFWRNVFDPEVGFVRGKDTKGVWRTPFDPYRIGHGATTANDFTEGNSWQYTWHVMQDPEGLVAAMGGREKALERLQGLFTASGRRDGEGSVVDVSGLIGQYAHGNEPSHHVIYLFQHLGRPDLTADYVRKVFDTQYALRPDGLCGNDDCGQMSAWYVFSALGFYPVNPCGGDYVLGAPQVPKATLNLPNGKTFSVIAKNLSAANLRVRSVMLNGRRLDGFVLKHADILRGGELVFEMMPRSETSFISVLGPTNSACSVSEFRRVFTNCADVVRAEWKTSGMGVYEAFVNGCEVGGFLKPGFTQYGKRRQVHVADVTAALKRGEGEENVLFARVSSGWWSDDVNRLQGKENGFWGELTLEDADGRKTVIGTDMAWQGAFFGPVRRADIFWGEDYDARETSAPVAWGRVKPNAEPAGALVPSAAEVFLREDLKFAAPGFRLAKGEKRLVDFGQNCAAVPRLVFSATRGVKLTMRFGEMLNDADAPARGCDGPRGALYTENLRGARAQATYVFAGAGEERWQVRHSFFGYRYLELSADGDVDVKSVESVPVSSISAADECGTFETDVPALNRFVQNVLWSQRSNYLSVPTDCPQRNERCGWTADTQVFAPAATWNADVYGFLRKWMGDMRDAQNPENAAFSDVAPIGKFGYNKWQKTGWSDAGVIVPWTMWRRYGRTEIIEENWTAMERYLAQLEKTGNVTPPWGSQFNDWLAFEKWDTHRDGLWDVKAGPDVRDYWNYLASCYWALDADMMADMAAATGRDAARYREMGRQVRETIRTRFLEKDGELLEKFRDMQTPALFALKVGVLEGVAKERTKARLLANFHAHGDCLQTGFLGTSILMDALTENGMTEMAYTLLLQRKCPSWLFCVDQGATTVWERWDSYTKERGFGPVGMNSFNHYAYGAVLDWMYTTMAGIREDPRHPGWRHVILAPKPDPRVGRVKATFRTPLGGMITSAWHYDDKGEWHWDYSVPQGTEVTVIRP